MKNYQKLVSLKTLLVISMLLLITTSYSGFTSARTYSLFVNYKQQQRSKEVTKIKLFLMDHCEKIWEDLAEYEAEAILAAAERYEIPVARLVAVVVKESEGYPFAVSRTGAMGASQIDFRAHADTFPGIKETRDKFDPKYNIAASAYLLRQYTKKYGYKNGLMIYNIGEGAYARGDRAVRYVAGIEKLVKNYKDFI